MLVWYHKIRIFIACIAVDMGMRYPQQLIRFVVLVRKYAPLSKKLTIMFRYSTKFNPNKQRRRQTIIERFWKV